MKIRISFSIVLLVYGVLYSGKDETMLLVIENIESNQSVENTLDDMGDKSLSLLSSEELECSSKTGDRALLYRSESLDVLVGLDDDHVHCGCGLVCGESRLHGKKQAYGTFSGYGQP